MTFSKNFDTYSNVSGTFRKKTESLRQSGSELLNKKPPLPPLAQTLNKQKVNPKILFSPKFTSSNTNLHSLLVKGAKDRKNVSMQPSRKTMQCELSDSSSSDRV